MLGLRDVHERGAVRVAVDGAHVLSGGNDGVVALFPLKKWPQSASLWARQCHTAAVTFVVLQDELHLAFSCGRDGHVFLHENIHAVPAEGSTSRLICKVTGEVRCMHFDATRRRLCLAGDSVRFLHMADGRFEVRSVPLIVPAPIAAVALSPCGTLLAMASTSGSVGVVSVGVAGEEAINGSTSPPAPTNAPPVVRVVLDGVLSPILRREDGCTARMQWCGTAGGLHLLVPAATEVAVLRYTSPVPLTGLPARLRAVGGLHAEGLTDFFSVAAYPVSAHRACCLMACREGLFIGKYDDRSLVMTRHTSQRYTTAGSAADVGAGALSDVHVCAVTGDVAVGLSSGGVSLLPRAALKAWDEGKEIAKRQKRATAEPIVGAAESPTDSRQSGEAAGEAAGERTISGRRARGRDRGRRIRSKDDEDDDFIHDTESESSEAGSSLSEESDSSEAASSEREDDSDADGEGSRGADEDLGRVVADLTASNAGFIAADGVERPSRWRDGDPRRALAAAERALRRSGGTPAASRFLDDEAEEGSGSDESSTGVGGRRGGEDTNDDEEDDDVEEGEGEGELDGVDSDVGEGSLEEMGTRRDGRPHALSPLCGTPSAAILDYSFQVGATPAGPEGSCYLAYNTTGFILCTREGTTIHFHDVSNPAVRIAEKGVILMGSLSPVGAGFIVAPTPHTEAGAGAGYEGDSIDADAPRLTVYYRTFVALGAQSDWRARLQPGETVRCMSAGIRHLAVATSRYLRLYSLSGLELAVLSKFPRIVAMAGTSSRRVMAGLRADLDPLAVVYLEGGEHRMEVVDVGTRSVAITSRVLPLTEGGGVWGVGDALGDAGGAAHQLQWLGWSEDGPLHTVDTAGVVRMYTESWGGAWVPVYDPRVLADQSYTLWVWGVTDEYLYAYRSVRSEPPYPAAVVAGLPVERAPLFIPLTRTATAAGERETITWDHMLRRQIRADELKRQSSYYSAAIAKHDALHDAKVRELFQSALRAQMTSRAMDLATMLELRDNIEDFAREANSGGHAQLVQKLLRLYELRVKSKSKRRCTLPLERAVTSQRERDELLRRLLAKERGAGAPVAAPATSEPTLAGPGGEVPHPDAREELGSSVGGAGQSPAKSVATTAITATTDRSPSAGGGPTATVGVHRRVTFNVPDGSPPPRRVAVAAPVAPAARAAAVESSSASTTTTSTTAPVKPSNPFAAKRPVTTAAGVPPPAAAAAPPAAPTAPPMIGGGSGTHTMSHTTRAVQPCPPPLPATRRTTFQTAPPIPRTTPPTMALLGVDSQPLEWAETPPSVRQPGQPRATGEQTVRGTEAGEGEDEGASGGCGRSSVELSPSGGRPTDAMPSPVKPLGFTPRALPPRETRPARGPVDPFLTESASLPVSVGSHSQSGTGTVVVRGESEGGPISVEALVDVGHEDSLPTEPRSSVFGEALRKRYRADEEDESSSDVVVPPTSFARV